MPTITLGRIGVKSTRIYINVSNAFIFTDYKGYNPEYNSKGDDSIEQGVDNGAYPLSRTVKFGINLNL